MGTAQTGMLRIVEDRLTRRKLPDLVAAHRRAGLGWRAIANDLHDRTGIRVSHETLRRHFGPPSNSSQRAA